MEYTKKCNEIAIKYKNIFNAGVQLRQIAAVYRELKIFDAEEFYLEEIIRLYNDEWLIFHTDMDLIVHSLKTHSKNFDMIKSSRYLQSIIDANKNPP